MRVLDPIIKELVAWCCRRASWRDRLRQRTWAARPGCTMYSKYGLVGRAGVMCEPHAAKYSTSRVIVCSYNQLPSQGHFFETAMLTYVVANCIYVSIPGIVLPTWYHYEAANSKQ